MDVILWLVLALVAGIAEAMTVTLVSVWFAAGAVCAAIASALGASTAFQWILFWVVSLVLLIITAPLCKKLKVQKKVPTNADRVIGQTGVVTEEIHMLNGTGEVKADGKRWSAKSAGGEIIPVGAVVRIEEISGVNLIVTEA
ncbi:MAG: NfeD family protein [Clostridia bacterium]|nr:NfeD family protein [Clostridia bacterium]